MTTNSKCHFLVAEVMGPGDEFPVSRYGWKQAIKKLAEARGTPGRERYLTFVCPGRGGIPMAQTSHGRSFSIEMEGHGGPSANDSRTELAGLRRKPAKKRSRR